MKAENQLSESERASSSQKGARIEAGITFNIDEISSLQYYLQAMGNPKNETDMAIYQKLKKARNTIFDIVREEARK